MHFYEFQVSSWITRNPRFGTRYSVKCVQNTHVRCCTFFSKFETFLRVSNFDYRVPSTVHRVPSTESRVSGDLRRDSELVKMHIILHLCCLNLRLEARKTGSSFEFRVSSLESRVSVLGTRHSVFGDLINGLAEVTFIQTNHIYIYH